MIGKPHKKDFKGLTPVEAKILEKHFTIQGSGKRFVPVFKVDHQSFVLGEFVFETTGEVSWFCKQFTYALARLVEEYHAAYILE